MLPSLSNVVTALANGAMSASGTMLANGAVGGPGGSYRRQAGLAPGREVHAQLDRWKPPCRWLLTAAVVGPEETLDTHNS